MRQSTIFILFLIGTLSGAKESIAQEKNDEPYDNLATKEALPIPKEKGQLFYLQRDPNANTVIYTLNLEDGEIDEDKPVSAHWIRYAENGERSDLSFIQRKMAYGVHHKKVNEDEFDIRIQAYKSLPIKLKFNKQKDRYQAFTRIENKEVVLEKIFVRIDGGSVFSPNVKYIEITGHDPVSQSKICHRFLP